MSTNKYIFLFIIFLGVMPCKVIFGQDIEIDTAVQSELDIRYDSILAKAASSLTASAFQQAIGHYKEASALKPGETYPYKMINYVEDLAAKQKRSDDLKRRAQIKNDLTKANQAIADRNWDSAKIFFNEILTLQPEKTDEEYAKAKIEAIDLELQRIAQRTPVKEEPPVAVIPPRNRREARAQRKLAERNAILAPASNNKMSQQSVSSATSAQNVTVAADTAKEVPKVVFVPKTGREAREQRELEKRNAILAAGRNKMSQQPVQPSLSAKNVSVAADTAKKIPQKPIETPAPAGNAAVALPLNKEIQQKTVQAPSASKNVASAADTTKEIQQQSIQTPTTSAINESVTSPAAKEIQPKQIEPPVQATNPSVAPPVTKEIQQKPVQTISSANDSVAKLSPGEIVAQKPTQSTLPAKNVALPPEAIQQKPVQATELVKNEPVAAPSVRELPKKPTDVSKLKLSDSSDYVKLICQDISFIGTNAYIKVLIQNYSPTAEFLTDTLHVSIIKNNGLIKNLDQRFISNFPVVMPLKELVLVSFSDASAGVEPDDIFIIEMIDKMRKTKLSVQVPWSLYTQSKNL